MRATKRASRNCVGVLARFAHSLLRSQLVNPAKWLQTTTKLTLFHPIRLGTFFARRSISLEPAALLTDIRAIESDNSSKVHMTQVMFEFILYIMIIIYLLRASDEIAKFGSLTGFLGNFWNLVDISNVFVFICIIAIRIFWMINAAQIEYDVVGPDGVELDPDEVDVEKVR